MNEIVLGYLLSIITSFFFTLFLIPKKLSKSHPITYTMFMGIGFFICSLLTFLGYTIFSTTIHEVFFSPILLLAALLGVLRTIGSFFLYTAIDKIGLSRSNQWKNLQGPIGAILMLILLSEFLVTNVIFIVLAILSIFISALLFTIKNPQEHTVNKTGIVYAFLSGIFYGIGALIMKYLTNQGFIFSQQVYFSFFIILTTIVLLWIIKKPVFQEIKNFWTKDNVRALIAGFLYFLASLLSTFAYKFIPGSIVFTIIQLNAVWTILAGVFIFKEINWKQHRKKLSLGIIFAILGIVALLYAQ